MGWEMELRDEVELVLADSIDGLIHKLLADAAIVERVCCLITDFWLGKENALEINVIGELRSRKYGGPIFLSSNIGEEYDVREFTSVIPKQLHLPKNHSGKMGQRATRRNSIVKKSPSKNPLRFPLRFFL